MAIDLDWSQRGYKPEPEPNWRNMYEAERDIVDKCWKALGITTYEQAKGKAIWELIAELKWMYDGLCK